MNKKGQQIDGWAVILFLVAIMLMVIDKNIVGGVIVILLGILRVIHTRR